MKLRNWVIKKKKGEEGLLGEEYQKKSVSRRKKIKWQKGSEPEDIPYLTLSYAGTLTVKGCSPTQRSTWAEGFTEPDLRR